MIDTTFIGEDGADYWYDLGFVDSQHALRRQTDLQWTELTAAWSMQSLEWQDRLAYILGADSATREVDLLVDMYVLGPRDTVLRAAETLRTIPVERVRDAAFRRLAGRPEASDAIGARVSVNPLLELLAASVENRRS